MTAKGMGLIKRKKLHIEQGEKFFDRVKSLGKEREKRRDSGIGGVISLERRKYVSPILTSGMEKEMQINL